MLITWALYVVAISTLLVAAAWGAERVLRPRGRSTRFVWAAAFLGSFLSPLLGGLFVAVRDVAASRGVGLARALTPASAAELHPVAEFLDRAAFRVDAQKARLRTSREPGLRRPYVVGLLRQVPSATGPNR